MPLHKLMMPVAPDSSDAFHILASALRLRSLNRRIYTGAYALPFGTLLPTVATSYIPKTLSAIGRKGVDKNE